MFGSIFRMRSKAGHKETVVSLFQEWERERKPKVAGAIAGYLFSPDGKPNELIGVAVFQDKQSYFANAQDPAQDRWYRKVREHLEADPAWEDSEVVTG